MLLPLWRLRWRLLALIVIVYSASQSGPGTSSAATLTAEHARLGAGYDAFSGLGRADCAEPRPLPTGLPTSMPPSLGPILVTQANPLTFRTLRYSAFSTHDYSKLASAMDVDISVSAGVGPFGTDDRYEYVHNETRTDIHDYIIIKITGDVDDQITSNRWHLSSVGTAYARNASRFFKNCGTEYVSRLIRGVRFYAVLDVRLNDGTSQTTSRTKLSAQAGAVRAKADIGTYLSTVDSHSILSITVLSMPGDAVRIRHPGTIAEMEALADQFVSYVQRLGSAPVVGAETSTYVETAQQIPDSIALSGVQEMQRRDFIFAYQRSLESAKEIKERSASILHDNDAEDYTAQDHEAATKAAGYARQTILNLYRAAEACVERASRCSKEAPSMPTATPQLQEPRRVIITGWHGDVDNGWRKGLDPDVAFHLSYHVQVPGDGTAVQGNAYSVTVLPYTQHSIGFATTPFGNNTSGLRLAEHIELIVPNTRAWQVTYSCINTNPSPDRQYCEYSSPQAQYNKDDSYARTHGDLRLTGGSAADNYNHGFDFARAFENNFPHVERYDVAYLEYGDYCARNCESLRKGDNIAMIEKR